VGIRSQVAISIPARFGSPTESYEVGVEGSYTLKIYTFGISGLLLRNTHQLARTGVEALADHPVGAGIETLPAEDAGLTASGPGPPGVPGCAG
jgi:hypothetical protein